MWEIVIAYFVYGDISSDVEGSDVMGISTMMEMGNVHSIHMDLQLIL